MPELPEVETIVRGLERRVVADTITSVWIGSRPQPLKSPAALIAKTLEGKRITAVHRAGKHIVFELEGESSSGKRPREEFSPGKAEPSAGSLKKDARAAKKSVSENVAPSEDNAAKHGKTQAQWVVHLGMTGRMVVCEADAEVAKHTHLIATLASGRELRFIDPRMFGKLSVHTVAFDPGGLEPLDVSEDQFIELFHGRKTPIKSALLNQKLLRGVGNIYADESLFRAGIRPRRRASSITRQQLGKLYNSVKEVLREAIALGGSSISDYVGADGEEGFFQFQHRVYGREGEPCLICRTPVRRVVLMGSSSHYCPKCQK